MLSLLPSRMKPLGTLLLEAWKVGVPTVATRVRKGRIWYDADGIDGIVTEID